MSVIRRVSAMVGEARPTNGQWFWIADPGTVQAYVLEVNVIMTRFLNDLRHL